MKQLITTLLLLVCLSSNAQFFLDDGFEQAPCVTTYPVDWMVTDSPIYTDSCGGYTTINGTEPPIGALNNHYFQIVTYDRTLPNRRDFLGHLLTDTLYPGDQVFCELGMNHCENTRWFTNGMGFLFSYGQYPVLGEECDPDYNADLQLGSIFTTDTNWTLFGGMITLLDTADRVTIGNFLCDDAVALAQDTTRPINRALYNVDNVSVFRISTNIVRPDLSGCTLLRSFTLDHIPVSEGYTGIVVDEYDCAGKLRYRKRLNIR